jgi:hypothetical protein
LGRDVKITENQTFVQITGPQIPSRWLRRQHKMGGVKDSEVKEVKMDGVWKVS